MASGFATVKEVLSGDTLVLIGQPKGGPPPEIRLTLASLQAPRMGSAGPGGKNESKDEPFAWASREFLRQVSIGKRVAFKVEYSVPNINRQFGSVRLTEGTKENLCVTVAREGWARVKKDADESERSADFEEMVRLGELAESQGKGVFNTEAEKDAVRDVTYEVKDNEKLLAQVKGLPQRAVVEYVRDGSSFKVLLLENMTFVNLNLAGVQCPRLNGGSSSESGESGPEPFAREAKYFTEVRLLNRDVFVVINGVDERFGTFYGSIEHPAGDISVELLKNGLARTADWSMQYTSLQKAASMRAAAKDAKDQRLRLWQNYVAPKISGAKSYEGVVAEIVSGDTMVIRVGTQQQLVDMPWQCEERRVSLSSIRAPRLGARSRNEPDAPFSNEARELLRSKCLGKKCEVSIEYERAPAEGAAGLAALPRKYGSVLVHTKKMKKNAAVLVVEEGLAEVLRHRADDERSAFYDDLQAAQLRAKEAGKGIHAPNAPTEPVERRVVDLTSNATQAKAHLSTLQQVKPGNSRAGVHKAIVEYIINASRFRVYIPGENVLLNFALGGIITPQGKRPASKGRPATEGEPYADEALAYTRMLAMQREVLVEVETMDKGGTAIGQCFVKKNQESVNLAVALVRAGLASVNDITFRYTSCGDELQREQKEAQRKRLNMWKDYEEPKEEDLAAAAAASSRKLESMTVVASEIVNGKTLFLQNQNATSKAQMESIDKQMAAIADKFGTTAGSTSFGIMEPKKNMNCLALFDDGNGNKWFRAKILGIHKHDGKEDVRIRYIDFGNEETVPMGRLLPASDPALFSNPPMAQECELAFVKVPSLEKEYGREAAICLSDLVYGNQVTAYIHGKSDEGRTLVSLYTADESKKEEEQENIAAILLRDGLGYVDSKQTRWLRNSDDKEILKKLQEAQELAHSEHINLWRYGDPRDDDE